MRYQINGLPLPWAMCPPLVETWLKQLKNVVGQRNGMFVVFKRKHITAELRKLRVPHVADFIEKHIPKKKIIFPATVCTAQATPPFFKRLRATIKKFLS